MLRVTCLRENQQRLVSGLTLNVCVSGSARIGISRAGRSNDFVSGNCGAIVSLASNFETPGKSNQFSSSSWMECHSHQGAQYRCEFIVFPQIRFQKRHLPLDLKYSMSISGKGSLTAAGIQLARHAGFSWLGASELRGIWRRRTRDIGGADPPLDQNHGHLVEISATRPCLGRMAYTGSL